MEYIILFIFQVVSLFIVIFLYCSYENDDLPFLPFFISAIVFISITTTFIYVDVFIQPITVETCKCVCDCCSRSS